jgi:superfamily II DNA or RNA helicase/HKD family nuclease
VKFNEELVFKDSNLSLESRVFNISPGAYLNSLTFQVVRKINEVINTHSKNEDFKNIITLIEQLNTLLGEKRVLELPLKRVLWSDSNGAVIPITEEISLAQNVLITNAKTAKTNFFKNLKFEFQTCDSFDLMVSFIRMSGLQLLIQSLEECRNQGKKGRVITSLYLDITEPRALRKLLSFDNIETRVIISDNTSFHTKAYFFHRETSDLSSLIIGSSNISQAALVSGEEWNVRTTNATNSNLIAGASNRFNDIWISPRVINLTEDFINQYEAHVEKLASQSEKKNLQRFEFPSSLEGTEGVESSTEIKDEIDESEKKSFIETYVEEAARQTQSSSRDAAPRFLQPTGSDQGQTSLTETATSHRPTLPTRIHPNQMQVSTLKNLSESRARGENRAVAIAATGTGKTFLAAFDAAQVNPKRLLFVAHRDELLEGAIKTFATVFGSRKNFGKLTGVEKQTDRPFIFSTIQTLSRENYLSIWDQDEFDYIVIDEFHHAQAESYLRVINHFSPNFLLGLTATPERMDGRDVLKLCNYNIVCDLRLREALEIQLLAPFHYFGVADTTVNYDKVQTNATGLYVEDKLVEKLNTEARVQHVISQIDRFGFSGKKLRVLGFCVNRDHAEFMATRFNATGVNSVALTGLHTPKERQAKIEALEDADSDLKVIFTVDIFNEGIDIPSVNMLLFLRPTESSTIFIQQLGRGLRKFKGKEYVTVLDFIGNYQNSFMVPMALAGETGRRELDKDFLKKAISNEFADLPDGCYVELDEVAKASIISKLESIRIDKIEYLKKIYLQFKREVGASPTLMDFLTFEDAPNPVLFISKFNSLYDTKTRCGDAEGIPAYLHADSNARECLKALEERLPLKWPYEYLTLKILLSDPGAPVNVNQVRSALCQQFGITHLPDSANKLIEQGFKELSVSINPTGLTFGSFRDGQFFAHDEFKIRLSSDMPFKADVEEHLKFGLRLFTSQFKPEVNLNQDVRFVLYQNYTRNDIQFLSEDTAMKGSWREGVKRVGMDYFLFINLQKDEDTVEEHLLYKDYFIDPRTFHWQSQNQTSHNSVVGQHYVNHKTTGHRIHLMIRKRSKQYGVTLPFTYMGLADYVSSNGNNPMSIVWKLEHAVPDELYENLIS